MVKKFIYIIILFLFIFSLNSCYSSEKATDKTRYLIHDDIIFVLPYSEDSDEELITAINFLHTGESIEAYNLLKNSNKKYYGKEEAYYYNIIAVCSGIQGDYNESVDFFIKSKDLLENNNQIDLSMVTLNEAALNRMYDDNINADRLFYIAENQLKDLDMLNHKLDEAILNFYKYKGFAFPQSKDFEEIEKEYIEGYRKFKNAYGENDIVTLTYKQAEELYYSPFVSTNLLTYEDREKMVTFLDHKISVISNLYDEKHPESVVNTLKKIYLQSWKVDSTLESYDEETLNMFENELIKNYGNNANCLPEIYTTRAKHYNDFLFPDQESARKYMELSVQKAKEIDPNGNRGIFFANSSIRNGFIGSLIYPDEYEHYDSIAVQGCYVYEYLLPIEYKENISRELTIHLGIINTNNNVTVDNILESVFNRNAQYYTNLTFEQWLIEQQYYWENYYEK